MRAIYHKQMFTLSKPIALNCNFPKIKIRKSSHNYHLMFLRYLKLIFFNIRTIIILTFLSIKELVTGDGFIIIVEPRHFQNIGPQFHIKGLISRSILKSSSGTMDFRLFTEYIGMDCKTFMGTTVDINQKKGILERLFKCYEFSQVERFHLLNIDFLKKSKGGITLKIYGNDGDKECKYIPLVIKEFEPKGGLDSTFKLKQKSIPRTIAQYKRDIHEYNLKLKELAESRGLKDDNKTLKYLDDREGINIAVEIMHILDASEEKFESYAYSEEDRLEEELNEKYKKALHWRGMLYKGLVSKFNGFELRVYSEDHDQHFHVIHKGKGINARFSFPELILINYKNSTNTISKKQERKIREFCLLPDIHKKLEFQFNKRRSSL